jgi:excisionase family DNA binding protein
MSEPDEPAVYHDPFKKPTAPILVDENEAARLLGLSAKTLYNMRRAGQLPFVRVRGRIMYRPVALEKWAESIEGTE